MRNKHAFCQKPPVARWIRDKSSKVNFRIGLHQRLGVNIPEADYVRLVTLDEVLDCLQVKLNAG